MTASATERPRVTARERRAAQQSAESRRFARACYETETTYADVTRALGIAASKAARWADPESRELPTCADIACFPDALRRWYAEDDARRLGLRAVEATADLEVSEHLRLLTDVSRESGEATAAHARALADGHLTDDELRESAREYGEAARVSLAAEHSMLAELGRRQGRAS